MQWVRTSRRFGAWCALVAIALQIILSFGHAHRTEGFPSGAPYQGALFQSAPFQPAAAIDARTAVERGDPASPAGLAFEYCAVCAVIKMGASAVPQEAPASGVPVLAGGVRLAPHADVAAWTVEHQLFQARAPPSA
jgi:hypothetical protein